MNTEKIEKNYWPLGLLIFGAVVLTAIITLLVIALNHKWEQDISYMSNYKNVDKHYDEIAKSQKVFEANYDVVFDNSEFSIGQNSLKLSIKDKNGSFVNDANITAVITRPDTNQFNQTITSFSTKGGDYLSTPFTLEKMGRWIVEYKIVVNQVYGYFKIERQTPRK